MNKGELIKAIQVRTGQSEVQTRATLDAFFDVVGEALKAQQDVQIIGFGTFEARQRAARTGKNPQTGEAIQIPAAVVPAFKAGKSLKDLVK